MKGLVVKNTGSWYLVRTDEGADSTSARLVPCKVKGNFRLKGIRTTNPVAVGDLVEAAPTADGTAYITRILPRRNYIIRKASNLSKEAHILASNIDGVLLLATVAHPATTTTFIDRFLATAEAYRVPTTLVINKADLYDNAEQAQAAALKSLYEGIGYNVCIISARTGRGVTELLSQLEGKTTLLSGHSGVGKSTLINALLPDAGIRTAALSDAHDMGMHTTTFSEMHALPAAGGYLIDTPGIKGFGTIDFTREETSHYFPEIFRASVGCRFGNCTHTREPGCAVVRAVEEGDIAASRYVSYLSILDDAEEKKYRE